MTYEDRLRISKWLFTAMLVFYIAILLFIVYELTIYSDGHLLETVRNAISAQYELRESVLKVLVLIPLLVLLWSKQFGTGSSVRLAGYIFFIVVISPWISPLVAKVLRLPSDNLTGTLPWGVLGLLILSLVLSIEPKET